jgi:chromosome segregation ATPase
MAQDGNGDAATVETATDVRGRASRQVKRLEERLGQTRTQLDRAKGRRDELEHLLQRMVDTESARRDQLKVREAEIERQLIEADAVRVELKQRLANTQRERDEARRLEQEASAELERREREWNAERNRLQQEARDELQARERDANAELERHKQQAQAKFDSLRSRIAELESKGEAASQELRDELAEARSQASREQEARAELEAELADQHELGRETSKQLVTAVERREELELAYGELEASAKDAKAQAVEARQLVAGLQKENARLKAQVEEAAARSKEEEEWHSQLEERLTETESQAESVLKEVDDELEITLGQTALERERRVAAETKLEDVQKARDSLREQVNRLELALSSSEAGGEPAAMLEELNLAQREIEALRAELQAARAEAPAPAPRESDELEKQVERLSSELESARVEAETLKWSHEQARGRIVQLEARLGELEPAVADSPEQATSASEPEGESDARSDTRTGLFGLGGATRVSRAPLKDPAELPGMSDEELAQAFAAMKQAAHLADLRGDGEGAQSNRVMARSIVEEAANRESFGEGTKVRGRKRTRNLRELTAAREKALEGRRTGAGTEAPWETRTD